MSNSNSFNPNWASAPGNTINAILIKRNISIESFAQKLNQNQDFVEELINGKIVINDEIAHKLEVNLGSNTSFWLRRDAQYREALKIEEEYQWLDKIPTKLLIKNGLINNTANLLQECLDFFRVSDIKSWEIKYATTLATTLFKKSTAYTTTTGSVAVWLRQGEIKSEPIQCNVWDADLFRKKLEEIRSLSKLKSPKQFLPKLEGICAQCGVAVAIVPTLSGCPASGAAMFLSPNRAMIMLSFRYLSDDHFWFTFFHEAAHLLLHGNKGLFVEIDENNHADEENEANEFASEILIPKEYYSRLYKSAANHKLILKLASDLDVSPGIIVGQLQHRKRIGFEKFNQLKRRYNWKEIQI